MVTGSRSCGRDSLSFESGEPFEAIGVAGVNEQSGIEQPELDSDFLPG
jgi:hypothetical protein